MAELKHLEFLQSSISRIAGYSFLAKGWSVSLVTAALALAVKEGAQDMALIALIPVGVFWVLDAYFLAIERGFRILFREAVSTYKADQPATFAMAPPHDLRIVAGCMLRPAVSLVHGTLLAILLVVWRVV